LLVIALLGIALLAGYVAGINGQGAFNTGEKIWEPNTIGLDVDGFESGNTSSWGYGEVRDSYFGYGDQ